MPGPYRKPYDVEFKRNAVELLIQSGKPLRTVARELGVSDTVLRNWKEKQLGKAQEDRSPPGEGGATLSARAGHADRREKAEQSARLP